MKTFKYLVAVVLGFFIFSGCAKELSFETGTLTGKAVGSLKSLAGDCQDITVNGQFVKGNTLQDSSYATVQVNFTTPGMYKVYTDTVNGFSFQDSGYMVATGLQSLTLKAAGKPIATQSTNFTVYFDTSFCMFTVDVTDTVVVRKNAVFTLAPGTTACGNATVQGTYKAGTALTSANSVTMQFDVTTPGSYTITAGPTNGMTFSAQGSFAATGLQTVTLRGTGTPVTAETDSIPITAGGTTCKFGVVVGAGTGGPSNPANSSTWAFTQGSKSYSGTFDADSIAAISGVNILALVGSTSTGDSSILLTIQLPGNIPVAGTYNTNTVGFNSFSFGNSSGTTIFSADYGTTGANIAIVIKSYDATTKTVTGTFSGTALNSSNTSVPITSGTFKAVLH